MKRDDWLEWRRNGIGASEVAGVLGLSPWQSPWSIWAEKTGLIPGAGVTEAMEFGLMAEVMLKQYFEKRTGLYVAGEQTWCAKPGDEWMRCTVDGFVLDPEVSGRPPDTFDLAASTAVYEAKTTSEPPWDEVPTHYACQAQWQMAVTGMPVCWFGVLHIAFGRPTFRVYEFARDDADIAMLTERCRAFWFDHVVAGVPPATDGHRATSDALGDAWEANDEAKVEADADLDALIAELRNLKAEVAEREQAVTFMENELKAALGESTAVTYGYDAKGKPITLATWRAQDRTTIDTKALRAEMPDVAAKFQTTTSSRVLRLTKPKG